MFKNLKLHILAMLAAAAVLSLVAAAGQFNFVALVAAAEEKAISVTVQGSGSPISGATVTVYAAGEGAPTKLAQGKTDANGTLKLKAKPAPKDSVLYLVAKGGTPKAAADKGSNEAVALMTLLGNRVAEDRHDQRTHHRGLGVHCGALHQRGIDLRAIRSDYGLRPGTFRTWLIL